KIKRSSSPEEAFANALRQAKALEALLKQIPEQPAGLGHNRPPEPLDDTPFDAEDRRGLAQAIQVIENQTVRPKDGGESARSAAAVVETKMHKVRAWLARQGDLFAAEVVKEAGKQFGKWMPRAFWMLMMEWVFSVQGSFTALVNTVFCCF